MTGTSGGNSANAEIDGELIRTADGGSIIAFDRKVMRPVEKVWAALTEPERIADWMGRATIDLRVGGRFRLDFHQSDDDPSGFIEGVITALDPPSLFEHTWADPVGGISRVRWELHAEGDACRLRFRHTFQPDAKDLIGMLSGWHDFLNMIPSATDGVRAEWGVGWRQLDAAYRLKFSGLAQ
jgi:uncharacterized protein YndB with AHSA1/START domain